MKARTDLIGETELRIEHFYKKAKTIPVTIKDADIKNRLPAAKKLCNKMKKHTQRIAEILQYQKIMSAELKDVPPGATINLRPMAERCLSNLLNCRDTCSRIPPSRRKPRGLNRADQRTHITYSWRTCPTALI
jgi:hypothetical protein